MDVAINNINLDLDCTCAVTNNDVDSTIDDFSCACTTTYVYLSTDWAFSNTNAFRYYDYGLGPADVADVNTYGLFTNWDCFSTDFCTSIAGCPFGDNFDPQCPRRRPTSSTPDSQQPDRCSSFTSVEDVNDPQEGIPSYSPSVERITIDEEGVVEMNFFGRGSWQVAVGEIEISVVVLLDEQYGA